MKNAILFIICCLYVSQAFTQTYHPFIRPDATRDEFWANEAQICYFDVGTRFWFRGDSSIGGQTYQKLCSAGIAGAPNTPFCPPYTVDTHACLLFGLLREDLAEKRVFQYDPQTGTEYLLYDFSLSIGDSVYVGIAPPRLVYVLDTLPETLNDGSVRRAWTLGIEDFGQTARWIEGIGNIHSFWGSWDGLCICPQGKCYLENDVALFGGVCAEVLSDSAPADLSEDLLLTPNPAGSILQVAMDATSFDKIVLFDMMGRFVLEKPGGTNVSSLELDVSGLPAGLYTVLAARSGTWVARQRFQKM